MESGEHVDNLKILRKTPDLSYRTKPAKKPIKIDLSVFEFKNGGLAMKIRTDAKRK